MQHFYKYVSVTMVLFVTVIAASAQSSGKIAGTVTYGGDNSAMHGVSIQIVELKRSVVTSDVGEYEFAGIPAGSYTVKAHQEGFGDVTKKIVVPATGAVTADFTLQIAGLSEEVTVSSSGVEQSTFESIASVDTLSTTEILSRASIGLGDVLENEAGVSKRSGGPGSSRPVIRGFDGDRVKVASDGVGVGSLASQSGDHSEPVDTLAAERIEVVKGPATLLYGSNAIGGVVNAISGHDEGSHPGFRGYFSTIGGTNSNQGAASVGAEYGVKNWMFWLNGSGQRTSDYSAGGDFGKVINTFTRNATATTGFGYYAKKAFFNANYSFYQSRYGIPLDTREEDPELRSLRVWRNDVKFNFGYNDPAWLVSGMKFTVDISNYRHQEIADGEVGTTFRNRVYSYRGMFDQKKFGKLTGRFGFDGFHRYYSTFGDEILIDGPVKQDAFSVFGLEELKFERVTLQFGGRVENNKYNPVNPSLLDRDFTGFSGAAGARFDLWKGGAFVANYSHGYRTPALEELYNHGPHDGTLAFEVGDPLLKAETNNGIDLSIRQQNKRIKAEANFYYYAFKNFVFLAPNGDVDEESGFPIAEYLQGDSRFTGTELSLDYTLNKYLNVITGFDYVNAKLKDGRPLPRIAPMRGRVGLDFHYKNASVRPEFVAVGDQDRVFTNETRTPGYGTVNLGGNYVLSSKHAAHIFAVNAFNLNNKLYYNHISFIKDISPEIGRGVRFSYTVRFF
ncbi:MAG TPA: TonB-dependent receptor [Pyrinomonadaceae bacterium]|jgi:iron complex outermembrane receptor protein|nr:TonB-dependent receptor [Pyrinomonadaceae bacterium]